MNVRNYNKKVLSVLDRWSTLGKSKSSTGALLIGNVTHVAPKAFLHVIFAALSKAEINTVEERLQIDLPTQFKEFLYCANGLDIYSGFISVFGFVPHDRKSDVHPHNYPGNILIPNIQGKTSHLTDDTIVVGHYKSDGSYVRIESDGRAVRFNPQDSSEPIQEWTNFDTWIVEEINRLANLFDETGQMAMPETEIIKPDLLQ